MKSPLGPKDAAQGRLLGKCHQRSNYIPSTTARQLASRSIFEGTGRMCKGRKLDDANFWISAFACAYASLKIELNVPGIASIYS
jgi:hypothetical protein